MCDKSLVKCANCGGYGHYYRKCNFPIISYGIICFRLTPENRIEYLMVQRKDSFCYVEFIRGKYDMYNKNYILNLFQNMTKAEQKRLFSAPSFSFLWKSLWQSDDYRAYYKEYGESKEKFNKISKGFLIKDINNRLFTFDFDYIKNNINDNHICEQEWGFPKGRRNINENDMNCAIREFYEETGFPENSLYILSNFKPVEEIFSGTNNTRYKHIYYVGTVDNRYYNITFNPYNSQQVREIRDMRWFDYDDVLGHINDSNIERKEIFKRVHKSIIKRFAI